MTHLAFAVAVASCPFAALFADGRGLASPLQRWDLRRQHCGSSKARVDGVGVCSLPLPLAIMDWPRGRVEWPQDLVDTMTIQREKK